MASASDYVVPTAYSPTSVWDDAAPASVTELYRYARVGKLVDIWGKISSADGDGKKIVSIPLPNGLPAAQIAVKEYGSGGHWQDIGGTAAFTSLGVYVDAAQALEANRVVKFENAVTCTDSQEFSTDFHVRYITSAT